MCGGRGVSREKSRFQVGYIALNFKKGDGGSAEKRTGDTGSNFICICSFPGKIKAAIHQNVRLLCNRGICLIDKPSPSFSLRMTEIAVLLFLYQPLCDIVNFNTFVTVLWMSGSCDNHFRIQLSNINIVTTAQKLNADHIFINSAVQNHPHWKHDSYFQAVL